MRRTAVALGVLLLLAQAVAAPSTSAAARRGTIRVVTIGRDGRTVHTEVQLVDPTTFESYSISSGHRSRVPRGAYDLMVDIFTASDSSDTLAAKRITVAAATTVTIHARRGKLVRAKLRPAAPPGYRQHFLMSLCGPDGFGAVDAYTYGKALYVIPSQVRSVGLAIGSIWGRGGNARFLAAIVRRHGLPNGITAVIRRSSLATVRIEARRGPESGAPLIELSGSSQFDCVDDVTQAVTRVTLPHSFQMQVSPGTWELSEEGQEYTAGLAQTYKGGHHYRLTINKASWGPAGRLPETKRAGHRIYLNLAAMFSDPTLPDGPDANTAYKLTKAGRTIYERTVHGEGDTLNPVLHDAGWYTLTASATRHPRQHLPADVLSTRSSFRLHFYADPDLTRHVRGYLTEFRPVGLDRYDAAQPGSSTVVALNPHGQRDDARRTTLPDAVKRITAWYSTNHGKSWHHLHVAYGHGRWSAKVPDAAPGYVSLRSKITDTHHGSCTTTVIRAYAVTAKS